MKLRIKETLDINESFVKPYTGVFWYINGEVIGRIEDISSIPDNETLEKHHWQVWNNLKFDYKVNGRIVNYDYFPRGRVYISKIDGLDSASYLTIVDMDKCLDEESIKEQIINYFNLYKNSFFDTIFTFDKNHYTCDKCRNNI